MITQRMNDLRLVREVPIKPAGLFWGSILSTLGFAGIYTMHGTIYLLPAYMGSERLRAHELHHALQRQRDGFFAFWFLTFWYLIRFGYWQSPYEVEARAAATRWVQVNYGGVDPVEYTPTRAQWPQNAG
jgi:hypothetical protein